MKDELIKIICDVLDVESNEVVFEQPLKTGLGVDSTEMVEIRIALGKAFGVKIEQGEITNNHTLQQILALIENKKG